MRPEKGNKKLHQQEQREHNIDLLGGDLGQHLPRGGELALEPQGEGTPWRRGEGAPGQRSGWGGGRQELLSRTRQKIFPLLSILLREETLGLLHVRDLVEVVPQVHLSQEETLGLLHNDDVVEVSFQVHISQ